MRAQIKLTWVMFLSTIAAGCACTTTTPGDQTSKRSNTAIDVQRSNISPTSPSATSAPNPMPQSNTLPQHVLPVTGGPPVMAIPLGGNMYLPVTGGEPIAGTPLFP